MIVTNTGGLNDSIKEYTCNFCERTGNGVVINNDLFEEKPETILEEAINRAIKIFKD